MSEWEWAHAAIGGVATVIFLFQTLGAADGSDSDSDGFDGSHDSSSHGGLSSYLSVRNFVAFFLGYGWVTLAALLSGATASAASLLGSAAGLVFVIASFFLIKAFLKFQEDGSLKLESLVGKHASVYITIGARGSYAGKVLVDARSGRVELPARSETEEDLRPGRLVRIVKIVDEVLWVE
jgi:membrane protein implicated in regulation of membrane protease activity